MSQQTSEWITQPPASDLALEHLIAGSPWTLPDDYLAYLRGSNGGEGEINVQPCYCVLWPAEDVLTCHTEYQVPDFAPGFLAFGTSSGGELFAFDMREAGGRCIVSLPCIGLSPTDAVHVADSFTDLTAHFGLPYVD